ncbi:MAG TPA: pantetheine-phosphate adenylyltransferase [Sutterella sp.]|nr:pantetheine-phosphate adenylyltransferase [Sutterella sp.]
MSKALYAGTFDPMTLGHEGVLRTASTVFDEVVLAVAQNTPKATLLSFEARLQCAQAIARRYPNVQVVGFSGLLAHFLQETGIFTLVRGLRTGSDFDYELTMADANARLDNRIRTVFLPSPEGAHFVTGTLVREIWRLGGDVSKFVSPEVAAVLSQMKR